MNRVVGTDQAARLPAPTSLLADSKNIAPHLRSHSSRSINRWYALKRKVVQRHLGMRVRTEQRRTFEADRPIAERGPFGADGHDADMFHARTRL